MRFVTNSANHAIDAPTSFPLPVFDPDLMADYQPDKHDTIIGHDVWLGNNALILPGAQIGNGVSIGAGAVVHGSIPNHRIVINNPEHVVRMRFTPHHIEHLQRPEWWQWSASLAAATEPALLASDISALEARAI